MFELIARECCGAMREMQAFDCVIHDETVNDFAQDDN
jgi:hypothetical protein